MFRGVSGHLCWRDSCCNVPVLLLKSFERSHVVHLPKKLTQDSNLMRAWMENNIYNTIMLKLIFAAKQAKCILLNI